MQRLFDECGRARAALPIAIVAGVVAGAMLVASLGRKDGDTVVEDLPGTGTDVRTPDGTTPKTSSTSKGPTSPVIPAPAEVSDGARLAEHFGPDTLAFVWCPSIADAEEHIKSVPLVTFFKDPEVISFLTDVGRRNTWARDAVASAGAGAVLAKRAFRKGIAVGILDIDIRRDTVEAVAVGELAEGSEMADALMDMVRPQLSAEGTLSKNSYNGTDYEVFLPRGEKDPFCFARLKDLVVATSTETALRKFLDRRAQKGKAPSLDDNARFKEVKKRLGSSADLGIYLDIEALLKKSPIGSNGRKQLAVLGLDGIKAAGMACRAGPTGVADRLVILAPGERRGLAALLEPKMIRPKAPSILPVSSAAMLSFSLEPEKLWRIFKGPLVDGSELSADDVDELKDVVSEAMQLRLEEDVLPAFGGEAAAAIAYSQVGLQQSTMVALEVRDMVKAERFASALFKLLAVEARSEVRTITVGDTTVRYCTMTGNPLAPSPCYAFKDRFLVAASSTGAMRQILAAKGMKALSGNESFRRLGRTLEVQRPLVLFVDTPRLVALGYPLAEVALLKMQSKGRLNFDAARLPTIDVVSGHVDPAGLSLTHDSEAISIDISTPAGLVGTGAIMGGAFAAIEILKAFPAARPGPGGKPKSGSRPSGRGAGDPW